jgi:dihydrofolate synthase/folylpolyglutamate synthase
MRMTTVPELPSPRTLADWLVLLEARHPAAIELGLERVAAVAAHLQLPRPAPRVVTVAGTNGKGSCIAFMEDLLAAAGQRWGSYTSPHLLAYNERVRIDGVPVADDMLCDAFARVDVARGDTRLTYFETGTLAAFLILADAGVDVALLEVGMGGRLDAVNIVAPDVGVITSIALDHQAWLGSDRDAIGVEKAGIARPEVPLICGDPEPPAAMLAALTDIGARVIRLGGDGFSLHRGGGDLELVCTTADGQPLHYPGLPTPRLPLNSAACAVQALISLGLMPDPVEVARMFADTRLAGRFQEIIWHERRVVLDVAHNPAAAALLAEQLRHMQQGAERSVLAVVGVLGDKDIEGVLAPLVPEVTSWYCCALPDVARGASADHIAGLLYNAAVNQGLRVARSCHSSPTTAFAAALKDSRSGDMILVFGSFHTVAPVLALLRNDDALAGDDNP